LGSAASAASLTIPVGSGPYGVAVNPSTNTVYVANTSNNSVSVINGSTNTVTSTVAVGSLPVAVAVNPSTNTVYVANSSDNSVSVINGSTKAVTATVSVGKFPVAVAVNPSTNFVYVANAGGNSVSVINGVTNTVTSTVPVGSQPYGVAVNPSTNTVDVSNGSGNSVSVINGVTNTVTSTIPVGSNPKGVAVNPSTNTTYVTNFSDYSVSVIAPATPPSAPTITSATGGSSQATIAWTDGASNGSPITSQTIYAYSGVTLVTTKADCTGSPCTVTGLTNGTNYTFKVTDTNGVGEGALSAASGSVIPLPAPTLSLVIPGGQILVPHWSGVTVAHGTVLSFTASASDLLGNVAGTCRTMSGSGKSCRITGLTGRATYQVTVTATVRIGTKVAGYSIVTTTPSNRVTGVPLAPRTRRSLGT
jgi:YVTN family beta-propeller protein